MATLDEARTTSDSDSDHVDDHNALHKAYNDAIRLPIDRVPSSPDSDDDEFDDDSLTGWTSVYSGSAATWNEEDGLLHVSAAAESSWNVKGQVKALPVSGDWAYRAGLGYFTRSSTAYHKPAFLYIASGATNAAAVAAVGISNEQSIRRILLNSYSSFSSEVKTNIFASEVGQYFEIEKSGSTFYFRSSVGGNSWQTIASGTLGFTPTHVGLGINVENSSLGIGAGWKWFRRES